MQSDALQKLRDIHLPADPSFWPLAPGWWILLLLIVAAVVCLLFLWVTYTRRQRPLRELSKLYQNNFAALQNRQLSPTQFVDETNELLKRHFVHSLGDEKAVTATGHQWIELMQHHYPNIEIHAQAAEALGQLRYQKDFTPDIRAVNEMMQSFLSRAKI